MAYKIQSSFSAGELDPALQERTGIDKYQSGLNAARNVIVGKTGRLISRPTRQIVAATKSTSPVRIFSPPNSGYFIEVGDLYIRTYEILPNATYGTIGVELINDVVSAITAADLPLIHFDSNGVFIFMFVDGVGTFQLKYTTGDLVTPVFSVPVAPILGSITPSISGTVGYVVDYLVTYVVNGEESAPSAIAASSTYTIPISAGDSIVIDYETPLPATGSVSAFNVYRRPHTGGAFGYIGSSSPPISFGGNAVGVFTDFGGDADFTHLPPALINDPVNGVSNVGSKTGAIYQQRLLVSEASTKSTEVLFASRPGYFNDFAQNFPIDAASALEFLTGTSGTANVLRVVDFNGLVAFTGVGIFVNGGPLDPTNLAMTQKGNWIIQDNLPTLKVPGGLLFVDATSNTVRSYNWSLQLGTYSADDLSIWSNHLFLGRVIVDWAYQSGTTPIVFAIFDDGTFATFTYDPEQKMQAWTRGDSLWKLKAIAGTAIPEQTIFVVQDPSNFNQYISISIPRYIPYSFSSVNTEANRGIFAAFMDEIIPANLLKNGSLTGENLFQLLPVAGGPWDGPLTLTCGSDSILTEAAGSIYQFFDVDTGSSILLTVTAKASSSSVTVQPSDIFPLAQSLGFNLYNTSNTFPDFDAFDNLDVSVMVDGGVVASPNNPNYPVVTISGGILRLPNGMVGSIINVGLPIVADIETLIIDSVEERPVFIESKTVNKIYIKILRSRGLFVANRLPEDDSIGEMEDMQSYDVDYENSLPIIGNTFQQPVNKRVESTIAGSWNGNGQVAIRQVDPVHFEILSIIPDIEDMRR